MNINELFENLQDEFHPDEINGEFTLIGNCIVWSYNLDNDSQEIDYNDDEDDENFFSFEAMTSEELLKEIYIEELEKIKEFLDENEEIENWNFSEFEVIGELISFKIY